MAAEGGGWLVEGSWFSPEFSNLLLALWPVFV
jgi:hypothetical protein